eukprot:COSAG01_NODE_4180_length_5264_cov_413.049371_6_plen_71_part_00
MPPAAGQSQAVETPCGVPFDLLEGAASAPRHLAAATEAGRARKPSVKPLGGTAGGSSSRTVQCPYSCSSP